MLRRSQAPALLSVVAATLGALGVIAVGVQIGEGELSRDPRHPSAFLSRPAAQVAVRPPVAEEPLLPEDFLAIASAALAPNTLPASAPDPQPEPAPGPSPDANPSAPAPQPTPAPAPAPASAPAPEPSPGVSPTPEETAILSPVVDPVTELLGDVVGGLLGGLLGDDAEGADAEASTPSLTDLLGL